MQIRLIAIPLLFAVGFTSHAVAADMPVKAAPAQTISTAPGGVWFLGFAAAPDSWYANGGAVWEINHTKDQDGWLFRIAGGGGHYSYFVTPGVKAGADFETGEVQIGYQKFVGATRFSGYVGGNIESHQNSGDPAAKIRGDRGGVKGQFEVLSALNASTYLYGLVTYSTVWNNYFAMGKIGFNVTPTVSVGPELISLGNDRFDAIRLGPFVGITVSPVSQLILSGGYSWDTRANAINDHSGGYGTVHYRQTF